MSENEPPQADEQVVDEPVVEQPTKSRALVLNEDRGYVVPTSMAEAFRMAEGVVAAGMAPNSYNNDAKKVTLGLMAALEAGLPPLYGLRQIAIINGRPSIWGDAAMALIQSKNLIAKQSAKEIGPAIDVDSLPINQWPDDYGFAVSLWRRGQEEPYVGRFTVGDAKRANLWLNGSKKPWIEHPKRMLMIRARAFPQRDGFADALAGLAIREEIEDTFGDAPEVDTKFLNDANAVEAPPLPDEEDGDGRDEG